MDGILSNLKIPKRFWQEAKLGSAILFSLSLLVFRASLGSIAISYNNQGFENFKNGRLDSAKQDFMRALKLNPEYMQATYNLGQVYESSQDIDNALTHYKIAAEAGSSRAYSTIGRLYNLKGDYPSAVLFLIKGKRLIEQPITKSKIDIDIDTRYAIFRNLGWARLKQARYFDAERYLQQAIQLIPDRGTAYCLLAQVLEGQQQQGKALIVWEKCRDYVAKLPPDQVAPEVDTWVGLAEQRLNSQSFQRNRNKFTHEGNAETGSRLPN